MATQPLRLLLLEDNPGDFRLVQAKLAEAAPLGFVITHAKRLAEALTCIDGDTFDVILSDLNLPDSERFGTVDALLVRAPTIALVVLTGSNDEAVGDQAIMRGAQDYLIKNDASGALIARTLRFAMERKGLELALRAANATLEARIQERTAALAASLASANALTATATDAIITADQGFTILCWNRAAERIFGYTETQALGQNLTLIIPELHWDRHFAGLAQALAGAPGTPLGKTVELTGLARAGLEFPLELSLSTWDGAHGKMYAAIMRDITERRRTEVALRVSETRFKVMFNEAPLGIALIDSLTGQFCEVNPMYARIIGKTMEEMTASNWMSISHPDDIQEDFNHMVMLNAGKIPGYQLEKRYLHRNGAVVWVNMTITPVYVEDKTRPRHLAMVEDITARKAAQEQIQNLAFFDRLTGLPNRRLLLDRLQQAITTSTRYRRKGALLTVDLDNFKSVNDSYGHDKGDLLLQQVGKGLSGCVREGDTVARVGGDEYAVLLEGLSADTSQAATQAEALGEKMLSAINQVFMLASHEYHGTASIGITLIGEQSESVEEPLKRSELAMYQAKAAGRNTQCFFDPRMQAVVSARAALEAALREAVLKSQFVLYYQAQVNDQQQITGMEALVRWFDPKRGLVSPAEFIGLAEETGLILPIGEWVLETACTQLALWAVLPAMAHLTVAVNVSARQFHQDDFVDRVLAVLDYTRANPRRLKLELTESLLVTNVEAVIAKMSALKGRGVVFSLDDFGTGYSSLSYLKRLPLNQLKIDQGFVRNILADGNDAAIAKMVIALAQSMGLAVIAEGVETEAQRSFLAGLGCHDYQGYLFSRPLPLAEFEAFALRVRS